MTSLFLAGEWPKKNGYVAIWWHPYHWLTMRKVRLVVQPSFLLFTNTGEYWKRTPTVIPLSQGLGFHFKFSCIWKKISLQSPAGLYLANLIINILGIEAEVHVCADRVYYRKRGSASYIVREVHSVREREKDGSDVTIVALKLAMSFALLLAKNVHLSIGDEFCAFPCQKICTSVSPLRVNGAEFTLSVAKNVALFETHSSHCQMAWLTGDRSSKANDRISGCTVLLSRRKNRKNESN